MGSHAPLRLRRIDPPRVVELGMRPSPCGDHALVRRWGRIRPPRPPDQQDSHQHDGAVRSFRLVASPKQKRGYCPLADENSSLPSSPTRGSETTFKPLLTGQQCTHVQHVCATPRLPKICRQTNPAAATAAIRAPAASVAHQRITTSLQESPCVPLRLGAKSPRTAQLNLPDSTNKAVQLESAIT